MKAYLAIQRQHYHECCLARKKKKSKYIIHPKDRFRTARHCWDHTAGDGLWTGHSWRLGWTLPERAFLEKKHISWAHLLSCSTLVKPLDKHDGRKLGKKPYSLLGCRWSRVWGHPSHPSGGCLPSRLVSIWRKIFSVLFSGVDSSSGIFITEETIL